MVIVRLLLLGMLALSGLVGWSWLRAQRNAWVRKRRGAFGWIVAALVIVFLVSVLKALLP
jgi:hypothetical protein